MIQTETIKYKGVELEVEYTITGKYIPASYDNPEEFPDVVVLGVYVMGGDYNLFHLLDEDVVYEGLIVKLWG